MGDPERRARLLAQADQDMALANQGLDMMITATRRTLSRFDLDPVRAWLAMSDAGRTTAHVETKEQAFTVDLLSVALLRLARMEGDHG